MKKKFFPKAAKIKTAKHNISNRTIARRIIIKDAKHGKSIRKEFDLIVNKYYSMLTAQEVEQLWHIIGTQIIDKKTNIGSLKNLISGSIRLITFSQ